jgi:hypothetical protein
VQARINALQFNPSGELLVTSSNDDSLHVYDALNAEYGLAGARGMEGGSVACLPFRPGRAVRQAEADALQQEIRVQRGAVYPRRPDGPSCLHKGKRYAGRGLGVRCFP